MKSRLAFSIACLVNPEILILDEVLSVGDGAFRKKSEAKMLEVIQGGATTILVSHSLAQIRRMATKVLWIEKGKQIDFGETEEICDKYEEFLKKK
jgi:ABC-2 type transport system ATP-binding protein